MISASEFLKYCYVFKVFDQGGGGGGGSVTAVGSGTGLTGGPITTSGTLSFAPIAANSLWANNTGVSAVPQVVPFSTLASALGFGTIATQNANAVNITGGTANLTTLRAPLNAVAMTANTNLAANPQRNLYVASSASVITLTDPAGLATYAAGTSFYLRNNGLTQNVVFQPFGSETVNGQTSYTILPGECFEFAKSTTNTNWLIIGSYNNETMEAHFLNAVNAMSTATLTGWTYNNGNAGVGATLTAPGNGLVVFDGIAQSVGNRVLYRNGGAQNGVYDVTVSSPGAPGVLTRAADNNSPLNLLGNRGYFVTGGLTWTGATIVQDNDVSVVGSTSISYSIQFSTATYLNRSGDSMSGQLDMGGYGLTGLTTPVNPSDAVNKAYLDSVIPSIVMRNGVVGASTGPLLDWLYDNGPNDDGIGATLTAPVDGEFEADGQFILVDEPWLYKDDNDGGGAYNGVYIVTVSDPTLPAVLTRAPDYDTPAEMYQFRTVFVKNGVLNGGATFQQSTLVEAIGSDQVSYALLYSPYMFVQITGGTMAGALNMGGYGLTGLTTPVNPSDAVTKSYADALVTNGVPWTIGVKAATTAALASYTYNNGTAGVGATLTAPGNGVFTIDGVSPPVGSPILYKNDAAGSGAYNGVYRVTTSSAGAPAVLTRMSDYNSTANMSYGRIIEVELGTLNGKCLFMQTTATVTTVGTTPVAYATQFDPNTFTKKGSILDGTIPVYSSVTDNLSTGSLNTAAFIVPPTEFEGGLSSVNQLFYQVGTIAQSGQNVTGTGTTFTTSMVGGLFVGATGFPTLVTGFTSATQITVARSQTIAAGSTYEIRYGGFTVDPTGNVSFANMYAYGNLTTTSTGTTPTWTRNLRDIVPGVTFVNSSALATTLTWQTGNATPNFGSNRMLAQTGSSTAGNMAVFNATAGLLQDGGAPFGAYFKVTVLTSTTAASFTKNALSKTMWVRMVGAAGAGGGGTAGATSSCGAGGGAGQYSEYFGPAANFGYTCGTGGAGVVGNFGQSGTNTVVTGLPGGTITTYGGNGGTVGTTAIPFVDGGDGGFGVSGVVSVPGENGGYGYSINATTLISGNGGSSVMGSGGASITLSGTTLSETGLSGNGYGAGGSGGAVTTPGSASAGGNGTQGVVIVYEQG